MELVFYVIILDDKLCMDHQTSFWMDHFHPFLGKSSVVLPGYSFNFCGTLK